MSDELNEYTSNRVEAGQLRQAVVVPSTSDFALRAEAEWKATEYDIAQMHLDEIGVPTELHQGGDRLSIVGRINILWRRAMKAESDLETINLRHGLKL
jgi:hypothetical protein